jgi:hypothetical protein
MDEKAKKIFANIETLLQEQLAERGVDMTGLDQAHLQEHLRCLTYPDGTMEYQYKEEPILQVVPVEEADGSTTYKFFTP